MRRAPTEKPQLESALEKLRRGAVEFARLPIAQRVRLLDQIRGRYLEVLPGAIRAGCVAKGLDPDSEEAGEEWFAHGYCIVRHLRLLARSLRQIEREGAPRLDHRSIRERPGGGLAVKVYPTSRLDAAAFPGIRAEAWLERGVSLEELHRRQASFYKHPHEGKVALVLGAGNVASIPPRDVLTKMFNEGKVCLLKMNPVNEYLGPFLERAFEPAAERGFFAIAYGGAEEGSWLAKHPAVDEIHVTGSDKTHDAIVWGPPGPERDERLRGGRPLLDKPITSELGNVSPVVVVPGPWTEKDFAFAARNVAGMVANNASFNCNAAKLLVQSAAWEGRGKMLGAIGGALDHVPQRLAYYPGAADRYRRLTSGRKGLVEVGKPVGGALPWALVPGLDPGDESEPLFRDEPWCSVLAETALAAAEPEDFLREAVRFLNQRVWGTLCCTLLVHPATLRRPGFASALEQAFEDLRYGTVALNLWPAAVFTMSSAPWGAHPSGTLADVQSGRGWIGNTLMLEGVEKTVVRAPFRLSPKPVWFPDHRRLATLGRRAVELERSGSWAKLPKVALAALRG